MTGTWFTVCVHLRYQDNKYYLFITRFNKLLDTFISSMFESMKPKINDSSRTVEIVITKVNNDKEEMCNEQDVIGSNTITIYVCELCSQQYHSLGLVHAHMQTYHQLIPSSGVSETGNQGNKSFKYYML